MKVGDLVKDKKYPEVGLIVAIKDGPLPYGILCPNGKVEWFTKAYVGQSCEVASEGR
jgi:hypothetical protein